MSSDVTSLVRLTELSFSAAERYHSSARDAVTSTAAGHARLRVSSKAVESTRALVQTHHDHAIALKNGCISFVEECAAICENAENSVADALAELEDAMARLRGTHVSFVDFNEDQHQQRNEDKNGEEEEGEKDDDVQNDFEKNGHSHNHKGDKGESGNGVVSELEEAIAKLRLVSNRNRKSYGSEEQERERERKREQEQQQSSPSSSGSGANGASNGTSSDIVIVDRREGQQQDQGRSQDSGQSDINQNQNRRENENESDGQQRQQGNAGENGNVAAIETVVCDNDNVIGKNPNDNMKVGETGKKAVTLADYADTDAMTDLVRRAEAGINVGRRSERAARRIYESIAGIVDTLDTQRIEYERMSSASGTPTDADKVPAAVDAQHLDFANMEETMRRVRKRAKEVHTLAEADDVDPLKLGRVTDAVSADVEEMRMQEGRIVAALALVRASREELATKNAGLNSMYQTSSQLASELAASLELMQACEDGLHEVSGVPGLAAEISNLAAWYGYFERSYEALVAEMARQDHEAQAMSEKAMAAANHLHEMHVAEVDRRNEFAKAHGKFLPPALLSVVAEMPPRYVVWAMSADDQAMCADGEGEAAQNNQ